MSEKPKDPTAEKPKGDATAEKAEAEKKALVDAAKKAEEAKTNPNVKPPEVKKDDKNVDKDITSIKAKVKEALLPPGDIRSFYLRKIMGKPSPSTSPLKAPTPLPKHVHEHKAAHKPAKDDKKHGADDHGHGAHH